MTSAANASFAARHGPWALVAGASDGLGAAFATHLASRGLNLVLIARSSDKLTKLAESLQAAYGVEVRPLVLNLARPDLAAAVQERTADLEIGLLVCNAALSLVGPFLGHPVEERLDELYTNCRAPLALAHLFGRRMLSRGSGGIIFMSSLVAQQGTALTANYGATKAYNLVLAEGLFEELQAEGIDVLACVGGAIETPNYLASAPEIPRFIPVPTMEPLEVAAGALEALGRGPSVVPGRTNRLAALLLGRLLPRRIAARIMSKTTRILYGRESN